MKHVERLSYNDRNSKSESTQTRQLPHTISRNVKVLRETHRITCRNFITTNNITIVNFALSYGNCTQSQFCEHVWLREVINLRQTIEKICNISNNVKCKYSQCVLSRLALTFIAILFILNYKLIFTYIFLLQVIFFSCVISNKHSPQSKWISYT